jgi:hypothetical protein
VSELPLRGDCTTVITPIDQATAGACSSFEQVPSAFIRITGECRLTHLGLTSIDAVQQLIFQLDANGQPVIVNGQPIITELRNCSTLTAANGDQLRHTSTGTVMTGSTSPEFVFEGTIDITGGTGRFENATGAATFVGTAGLTTGMFSLSGTLSY